MVMLPGAAAQGEGAGVALRQDRGRADAGQQAQPADQGTAEQARGARRGPRVGEGGQGPGGQGPRAALQVGSRWVGWGITGLIIRPGQSFC